MHKEKLQFIQKKWDLKNIECIYKNNLKSVYRAESSQWGNIILKENLNLDELTKEYNMLKALDGYNACKVYDIDMENCILIEEQIIPGIVLRNETSISKRVDCFIKLFNIIHKEAIQCDVTYLDWIKRANEYCINKDVKEIIKFNMQMAHQIGEDMFLKYKYRVLLHGDFHHDNIL